LLLKQVLLLKIYFCYAAVVARIGLDPHLDVTGLLYEAMQRYRLF
jgi:hypothetical protein